MWKKPQKICPNCASKATENSMLRAEVTRLENLLKHTISSILTVKEQVVTHSQPFKAPRNNKVVRVVAKNEPSSEKV